MVAQTPILIVVIPLIFAFLSPLMGLWRKGLCYWWAILALSLCCLASIDTLFAVMSGGTIHYRLGSWAPPFGIEYVVDHLNAMMLVIVSLISLIVTIYSRRSVEQELPEKVVYFYTVFLLQVTGFLGIVITGDLFNLYVFLEIASLAGLAPWDRSLGKSNGQMHIWGGRKDVRSVLYMAAFTACRFNPVIRSFAENLRDNGKAYKVIITACMRKLLIILNTMVRNQTPWTPKIFLKNL